MSRSVLPHRRLADLDSRIEHAAARPVIVPETIVCDHGMVYMSATFRSACRAMGISIQAAHKGSPWEKGAVERSFGSVATLFSQHVAGYVGSCVERRGRDAEQAAAWTIAELQDLLDEWIVACWQNRPHDGLRDPLVPGRAMTPNEKYAALAEVAGYVPVPLPEADYIELLAVTWRTVNAYGIKIGRRTYDCEDLNPCRRQDSGVTGRNGRWEVHYDPYDITRIWVRNHHGSGWITVPWTYLRAVPVPFGELAWEHARKVADRDRAGQATEQEIARSVSALLDKAAGGPGSAPRPAGTRGRRGQKVAARTRAVRRAHDGPQPGPPAAPAGAGRDVPPAEIAPLPVFDPFTEARKRW
jgi:putative transposase